MDIVKWLSLTLTIPPIMLLIWKLIRGTYFFVINVKKSIDILQNINTELTPNGGASLADKINWLIDNTVVYDERQKIILNDINTAVFCHMNNRLYWVNVPATELCGLSKDELLEFGWFRVIHPDDRDEVVDEWNESIKDGIHFWKQFRIVRPNKEVVSILLIGTPVFNYKKTKLLAYIGTGKRI